MGHIKNDIYFELQWGEPKIQHVQHVPGLFDQAWAEELTFSNWWVTPTVEKSEFVSWIWNLISLHRVSTSWVENLVT